MTDLLEERLCEDDDLDAVRACLLGKGRIDEDLLAFIDVRKQFG